MRLVLVFSLYFLLHITSNAQVVNVERLRMDSKKQGWSGSADGNLDLRRNQNSVFSVGSKMHVQHRKDSNTTLLFAQAGFIKASQAELVNFAFSHFRYTHYVTDFLSLEGFTQLQQNRVNGIANRWLLGCGVRGKVYDRKPGTAFVGFLVMREREREVVDSIPIHKDVRISTYLAGSYTPESADWITVATTTYFQPRIGKFSDFRVSADWNLQVRLRENISLFTSFNLVYDSNPPFGLNRAVYAFLNGLKFSFG